MFKKLLKLIKRLSIFEWLAILVVAAGLIFLVLFIFKQEKWVKVEVKVTESNWSWDSNKPPYWLVDQIAKGDVEYDSLGRKIAEVTEVKSYDTLNGQKMAYITLNLKAEVDKLRKKLKFDQQPLEIGMPVNLSFSRLGIQGLVTYVSDVPDPRKWGYTMVEVRYYDDTNVFPETLGVQPWKAAAIHVGDKMKDNNGNVVAEILDKKVTPAEKIVTTADGRVLLAQDPIKEDVYLTVKLRTFTQGGLVYYLDNFKIKVSSVFLLALPQIDILPEITKILE